MVGSALRYVNFHGVGAPARRLEPGEDRYWIGIDRFRRILDEVVAHPQASRIRITFDDGNISDLSIATPELLKRNLAAQFFVLAGRMGQRGSLAPADLRDMIDAGMEVGSHGVDHLDWTRLSRSKLEQQLKGSMNAIEDGAGVPVVAAAVPFGRYNGAVLAAVNRAGYEALHSSDGGPASTGAFLKPRTSITADMADVSLENILSGRMSALQRVRRWTAMTKKRWT